jgi:hypothetical protein
MDPDPGDPKTYGSYGSGFGPATLVWDKTQPPNLKDLRVAVGGGVLQAGELQRIDGGANIPAS